MNYRAGEENLTCQFFRSERILQVNQDWFFLTRGGQQEGPFVSQAEAQQYLQMFLSLSKTTLGDKQAAKAQQSMATVGNHSKSSSAVDDEHPNISDNSTQARNSFPFAKVASVVKPPFKVRRIEFTPVAHDVTQVSSNTSTCANDSFHFCCL